MNRIFRLSLANIRRHKTESFLLGLLVMLCMTLLGGSLAAEKNVSTMFPEMMARTGAWENDITELEQNFDERFLDYLAEDSRIAAYNYYTILYSDVTRIPDKAGKSVLYPTTFFTEYNLRKALPRLTLQSTLSDAEIAAIEHPIYIIQDKKETLGVREKDSFTILYGSKRFTFTVAGFFEGEFSYCGVFMVSDADYAVLKPLFTREIVYCFNTHQTNDSETATAICQDFMDKCSDTPGARMDHGSLMIYKDKKGNFETDMTFILKVIEMMAVVIILSVAVMIGFRIVCDIKEQIVSIGVLEALGYRSAEIALSYAAEYFLIAAAGCLAGLFGSAVLFRGLTAVAEHMEGYPVNRSIPFGTILLVFVCILAAAVLLAFCKSRAVRKYPPVLAFRKGIAAHNFGKCRFPLRNTKKNVHLRLALKGFVSQTRRNISLTFVVSITTLAVVLSFILYSFLGKNTNVVNSIAGHEMSAIRIQTMPYMESDRIIQTLETVPGIRKVLASGSSEIFYIGFTGIDRAAMVDIYDDFTETENIFPMEGRFPAHENEIMLSKATSNETGFGTGDTVTLELNSVCKEYLVTGIVTALVNADCIYITADGIRRLCPTYMPDLFEVYTEDGTDTEKLRTVLDETYGNSAVSLGAESEGAESYEARIRARAEQVMTALMQQNGITQMEYSIQANGKTVSGSSSGILIKDYQNWPEMVSTVMSKLVHATSVLTTLFMFLSAAVVMLILSILMESEIRRQRRELGIMKSMGYTSKELMLQLAFRIMPAALIAVAIGTVMGITVTKVFVTTLIGRVPVSIPAVLAVDVLILGFCFGCAYLSARKIKKISVCELMTE